MHFSLTGDYSDDYQGDSYGNLVPYHRSVGLIEFLANRMVLSFRYLNR